MTPPKRVKVGPVTYRVRLSRATVDTKSVEHHCYLLGLCEHEDATITLRPGGDPSNLRVTFAHEMLHALNWLAGLEGDPLTHAEEEAVVNRLAPLLVQVLRDNPDVVAYLTEGSS